MQFELACESCDEVFFILAEELGNICFCPRCGRRCAAVDRANGEPFAGNPSIDDIVVSWLGQTPSTCEPVTPGVATCQSCGYPGMTRGQAICPACGADNRPRPPEVIGTVDCPNCGQAIELLANDRGKTTICPRCKYFLGCVNQASKPLHRGLFVRR